MALPEGTVTEPTSTLRGLSSRRTAAARERLARDPLTREFVLAGAEILGEVLGTAKDGIPESQHGRDYTGGVLSCLSQRRVVRRVQKRTGLRISVGALRDRWLQHEAFLRDVLAFLLWEAHWDLSDDGRRALVDAFAAAPDPVACIERVVRIYLESAADSLVFYVHPLIGYVGMDNALFREEVRAADQAREAFWTVAYTEIFAVMGVRLRPHMSVRQLYWVTHALVVGLLVRIRGGGMSMETAVGLLTDHFITWIVAASESADGAQAVSLAAVFRARLASRPG
jgi:hypothetical protein